MRSIALFAAVCSIVVCEGNTCKELCHMQKEAQATNFNLTRALEGCCDEATACVLPARFYNDSCVNELLDVCNSESRSAVNLTWTRHFCCGNWNSNETGTEFNEPRKCVKNISVGWNDERFWPVRDQTSKIKWNEKHWTFLLKIATLVCLKGRTSLTPSSVTITYKYPIFTERENYEKRFVHAFYAPAAYLVMKKGDHDMLTILGESVKHLWVTLCICITWTVISGIIIWLLVSLVTLLFDKLSAHFLYSRSNVPCRFHVHRVGWKWQQGDNGSSLQLFCSILFIRKREAIYTRSLRLLL